jgi:hypothetical protein
MTIKTRRLIVIFTDFQTWE